MLAQSANYEDVKKYYEKTYVKLEDFGDEIVYVERVIKERIEVVNPITKEPAWVMLNTRPYELSFVLPRKTVYQMDQISVMLSRIPARMWKKGLTHSNTKFQYLDSSGWRDMEFDIKLIVKFVEKPTYLTLVEALDGFKNNVLISAALSKRVSLSASGNVYVDSVLVARFKDNTLVTRRLFEPTLSSLFPNATFTVLK